MKKIYMLIALLCSLGSVVTAQEFRKIKSIKTPYIKQDALTDLKGEKVKTVTKIKRLDPQLVEKVVKKFVASWNTADMQKHLAKSFYQRDRLVDSMNSKLPTDAKLRLLSIGSHRVIDQGFRNTPNGKIIISRVAVLVRTQVEYHNTAGALQRRESEQEYTIKIKQGVTK